MSNGIALQSQPPPQTFTWDTTLKDFLTAIYVISPELLLAAPRCLRLYADRIQVNWQESGLTDGSEATVIEMTFSARPMIAGAIVPNIPPP